MAKKEVNKGGYRITLDCISINIKDEENEGNLSFMPDGMVEINDLSKVKISVLKEALEAGEILLAKWRAP